MNIGGLASIGTKPSEIHYHMLGELGYDRTSNDRKGPLYSHMDAIAQADA